MNASSVATRFVVPSHWQQGQAQTRRIADRKGNFTAAWRRIAAIAHRLQQGCRPAHKSFGTGKMMASPRQGPERPQQAGRPLRPQEHGDSATRPSSAEIRGAPLRKRPHEGRAAALRPEITAGGERHGRQKRPLSTDVAPTSRAAPRSAAPAETRIEAAPLDEAAKAVAVVVVVVFVVLRPPRPRPRAPTATRRRRRRSSRRAVVVVVVIAPAGS